MLTAAAAMDSLGAEVSSKIRAAIKAKLVEQEVYVDDELPDYIMVMIANHKTGEHMADDLRLFLNENTDGFVEWLVQVLAKLKKVTAGKGGSMSEANQFMYSLRLHTYRSFHHLITF